MRRGLFAAALVCLAIGFSALGVWQLERRAWKLDLIRRVEAHLQRAPAPIAADFRAGPRDAYLRVEARGVFLHDRETLVQALTERGAGWWVVTPLQTPGGIILVNRGFVPPERRAVADRPGGQPAGPVAVRGLLRLSEPGGGFLRANDPGNDRWYSRDVSAIARARGLENVAGFFIDADGAAPAGGYPVSGLTVVKFRNTHLVYALTWFSLAGMSLFGAGLLLRGGQRGAGAKDVRPA